MPEMRYFTIIQTREIKVRANSVGDAAAYANAVFTDTPSDLPATVLTPIREIHLEVSEDGHGR